MNLSTYTPQDAFQIGVGIATLTIYTSYLTGWFISSRINRRTRRKAEALLAKRQAEFERQLAEIREKYPVEPVEPWDAEEWQTRWDQASADFNQIQARISEAFDRAEEALAARKHDTEEGAA